MLYEVSAEHRDVSRRCLGVTVKTRLLTLVARTPGERLPQKDLQRFQTGMIE